MGLIYRGNTYNCNLNTSSGRPFQQVREAGPAYNLNYLGVNYRVDPNTEPAYLHGFLNLKPSRITWHQRMQYLALIVNPF